MKEDIFVILVNIINSPIEKSINNGFIKDAKRILSQMPDLKIIGVTGSYGKTSVKYYLQTLLKSRYNVLVTPASFNTPMGVVRTIREELKPIHEIFVCEMGVAGAALATIISQFVSFVLLLWMSIRAPGIHIQWRNLELSFYYFKEVFRGGFPSLCRQGLASIAGIALNLAAGVYGDAAIAGMSIVSRITMLAFSVLLGFGQGFQPVCGFNYGAKKYDRVREAFFFCLKYATIFLFIVSVLGYMNAPALVSIFRKGDPDVTKVGIAALRYMCLSFTLTGGMVMSNMFLQSIGKAFEASLLATARQGLFFLPLIFILPKFWGLQGVEMCQMISDILTFCLAMPMALNVLRGMKNETVEKVRR